MILNCSTEKSIRMQHNVGQALHDMLKEMPYDKITVSDLCERAGLPRRSFYRYFNNKNDVLDYAMMNLMRECILYSMDGLSQEGPLEEIFLRFFTYWKDSRPEWLRFLSTNHLEVVLIRKFREWFYEERRIQYKQKGISEEHLQISMTFVLGGIMMMLFQWAADDFRTDAKDMARYGSLLMTQSFYPTE